MANDAFHFQALSHQLSQREGVIPPIRVIGKQGQKGSDCLSTWGVHQEGSEPGSLLPTLILPDAEGPPARGRCMLPSSLPQDTLSSPSHPET